MSVSKKETYFASFSKASQNMFAKAYRSFQSSAMGRLSVVTMKLFIAIDFFPQRRHFPCRML